MHKRRQCRRVFGIWDLSPGYACDGRVGLVREGGRDASELEVAFIARIMLSLEERDRSLSPTRLNLCIQSGRSKDSRVASGGDRSNPRGWKDDRIIREKATRRLLRRIVRVFVSPGTSGDTRRMSRHSSLSLRSRRIIVVMRAGVVHAQACHVAQPTPLMCCGAESCILSRLRAMRRENVGRSWGRRRRICRISNHCKCVAFFRHDSRCIGWHSNSNVLLLPSCFFFAWCRMNDF